MARFRCRACGKEGTFVYETGRHACPLCGSLDVQFAVGIEELPDDDPLIRGDEAAWPSKTARRTRTDEVLLWILSDLHLELTRGWDLPSGDARPRFDVLVVAGDLVPRMERGVAWLRERVPDRPVIYVAGNHEGYGCDVDRTVEKAKRGRCRDSSVTCSRTRASESATSPSRARRCGPTSICSATSGAPCAWPATG